MSCRTGEPARRFSLATVRQRWRKITLSLPAAVVLICLLAQCSMALNINAERVIGGEWGEENSWELSPMSPIGRAFPDNFVSSTAPENYFVNLGDFVVDVGNIAGGVTISQLTIGSGGGLRIDRATNLTVEGAGTIQNASGIEIAGAGGNLVIKDGEVTLTGEGVIQLANATTGISGFASAGRPPPRLINEDNDITGFGLVGHGDVSITNRSRIVAETSGKKLQLDPDFGTAANPGDFRNEQGGTLLATNGGILELFAGTFNNFGGTIRAEANSFVDLAFAANVRGGNLEATGTGRFRATGNASVESINLLSGVLDVQNGHDLTLRGNILNNGEIALSATDMVTRLLIDGTVELVGSGSISFTKVFEDRIQGINTAQMLINGSLHTIAGSGRLGNESLVFQNKGIVSANFPTEPLLLEPTRDSAMTNAKVLEARNGGRLRMLGPYTVENAMGTIRALDDSIVELDNVIVRAGLLTNKKQALDQPGQEVGVIKILGTSTTLVGPSNSAPLINDALVDVTGPHQLHLEGTIDNRDSISLISRFVIGPGVDGPRLSIDVDVRLRGGGRIVGRDEEASLISNPIVDVAGATLVNVDNTIEGEILVSLGNDGTLRNENGGTIHANRGQLSIVNAFNTQGQQLTNAGTLKATNGFLLLDVPTTDNRGGTIEATGSDKTEIFIFGGEVIGGQLRQAEGAIFRLEDLTVRNNAVLSGTIRSKASVTLADITNLDTFFVDTAAPTTLIGTIRNAGQFDLLSTLSGTLSPVGVNRALEIAETGAMLTGRGEVNITKTTINGQDADAVLTNLDNRIAGDGTIHVALTNEKEGQIIARDHDDSVTFPELFLKTHPKTNHGTMRAESFAVLNVSVDVDGTGQWIADGGQIKLTPGVRVSTTGPVTIQRGGALQLRDAGMNVSLLRTDGTATIDIQSTVSVTDGFSFAITDEANWIWGADSDLEMLGGVGAETGDWNEWGALEAAGTNLGDDPAGFTDNFEIPELIIGPAAHITLVDVFDNGNRNGGGGSGGAEALYVDTLTFADLAGMLNLNGTDLYFNTLNGDASQIIDMAVHFIGDYNESGIVDAADYTLWKDTLGSTSDLRADGNGDGVVNQADYDVWTTNYGTPFAPQANESVAAPEPSLLVMLASLLFMALAARETARVFF